MATIEIQEIVKETLAQIKAENEHECRFDIDPETHRKHHDVCNELIQTLQKIGNLKWGVLQAVVIAVVLASLILLWKHGVKGP